MLTFQVDSFEASQYELSRLFPTHHRELGLLRGHMPLDPDWHEYIARERAGSLFMVSGRKDGDIVAYYVANVRPGFHYKSTLTGTMDLCYVVPEMRDRGLVLPLFRTVEKELQRRGVKVWYSGYKTNNPMKLDGLHELLGFIPADSYTLKWIGGPR